MMKSSRCILGTLMLVSMVAPGAALWAADASHVYDTTCSLCHQGKAVGIPGQFPRLAGRVRAIAATEAGRRYLTHVVLFGMAGKLEIDGAAIIGVMPAFATLSDDDLAAALNYVVSLEGAEKVKGKPAHFTVAELRGARAAPPMTPSQVRAERDSVLTGKLREAAGS